MPKVTVRVDRAYRGQVDPRRLREAARKTLAHAGAPTDTELTLVVTGDEQIRELNRTSRGIDAPTDVLSFGETAGEQEAGAPFAAPLGEHAYLGDVIISYPRAESQAAAGGHPVENEMLLLVVHGVLHLLGHDHAGVRDKRKMWAAQEQVLDELGIQVSTSEQ